MPAIHDRLQTLKIALPEAPKPVAAYIPAVKTGNLIYVSGQVPFRNGKLLATGPVPSRTSINEAQEAAKQCVLNGLAILNDILEGDLDRITRIVKLGVFIYSDPDFSDQPKVANGASELLQDIFGESGRHARAAVGSVALPLGASVEVEMIVEVAEK